MRGDVFRIFACQVGGIVTASLLICVSHLEKHTLLANLHIKRPLNHRVIHFNKASGVGVVRWLKYFSQVCSFVCRSLGIKAPWVCIPQPKNLVCREFCHDSHELASRQGPGSMFCSRGEDCGLWSQVTVRSGHNYTPY